MNRMPVTKAATFTMASIGEGSVRSSARKVSAAAVGPITRDA